MLVPVASSNSDLSLVSRARYAPPRNLVFLVTKYFSENKNPLKKQLSKSKTLLSLDDLQKTVVLELANPKYKQADGETIKRLINLILDPKNPNSQVKWTTESFPEVVRSLPESSAENITAFTPNLDLARTRSSLHQPLIPTLRSLLLFERRVGNNHERSPATEISPEQWLALRPREREAADLELLGFSRDEIAEIMGISNRSLTNHLLNFRTTCGLDQTAVNKIKRKIQETNLDEAYLVRDRLIDFVFPDSTPKELTGFDDKQLFVHLLRLMNHLKDKQGTFKLDTLSKLKLMMKGASVDDIAEEAGVTASTIRRDLASVQKTINKYCDKFEQERGKVPEGINPYSWVSLNQQEQDCFRLFLRGFSYQEISDKQEIPLDKVPDGLRHIREKMKLSREYVLKLKDDNLLAKPRDKFLKERLLDLVFPEQRPQVLDASMKQEQYEQSLYKKMRAFINTSEFKHKESFEIFLKGLDSGAVTNRLKETRAKLNSSFGQYLKKLRTHVDKVLAIKAEEYLQLKLDNVPAMDKTMLDRLYHPNSRLSVESQGIKHLDQETLVKYINSIARGSETLGRTHKASYQYLRGLNIDDLAKLYGYSENKLIDIVERDIKSLREEVTDFGKRGLPCIVDPTKWLKLHEKEKLVIQEFSRGKNYQQIFKENRALYGSLANAHAALYRAVAKLEINREALDQLRKAEASKNTEVLNSKSQVLTRIFGKEIPSAPDNIEQNNFETWLYSNVVSILKTLETDYMPDFIEYLKGLKPKEIANLYDKDFKKVQAGIFAIKKRLTSRLESNINRLKIQS
jgi:DNA-binding CsgD family transcriptional regulator